MKHARRISDVVEVTCQSLQDGLLGAASDDGNPQVDPCETRRSVAQLLSVGGPVPP